MNHERPQEQQAATPGAAGGGAPARVPPGPRRVRSGVRLTLELDELRRDLRALPWLLAAERAGADDSFALGLEYARAGQAVSLHVSPGHIGAEIQGVRRTPYRVTITISEWTEDERQRAIAAIANEPALFGELLVGDVSKRLVAELARQGLNLAPARDEVLTARCACPRGTACKHIAATLILMAERSVQDPTVLPLARGLSVESLVDRIQQQRGIDARGAVPAHPEPALDALALASTSLDESVESFWTVSGEAPESLRRGPAHHASHALLRRLGPSPLPGRFPIVGLLASIYDEVSTRARKLLEE